MMSRFSVLRRRLLLASMGLSPATRVLAQSPAQAMRIILPVGPGSGVDTIARAASTPEAAARIFRSELGNYAGLVRQAGVKID